MLTVRSSEGQATTYDFGPGLINDAVTVNVGETMQWRATSDATLIFYEACTPPYEKGRFENL
jgi:hypothetical protein